MGLDLDDMTVKQFTSIMAGLQQTLNNISLKLGSGTGGPTLVRTQSYNGHYFLVAPTKAQANAQKYTLQHYADAVVVTCPYDFQVDFDSNVSDTTPATASYSLPSFELRVNEFISYKLAPNVPNVQSIQAPFYIWLFWYQ